MPEPTRRSTLVAVLRSPWPRFVLLAVLLVGFGVLALTGGGTAATLVREWAADVGAAGAVVFALGYALATVMLLPGSVLSAAAGALFGPVLGVGVVFAGALLGAAGSFQLGRVLGRDAVDELVGGRIERLNAFLARHGTAAILIARLVPLFPFALVNYGFAVTSVGWAAYLAGTAIGILPGTIAYVVLGDNITDPTSLPFPLAAAALLVLVAGGTIAARRMSGGQR